MRLTIITPCIRFENLPRISASVPSECQWIIVADAPGTDRISQCVRARPNVETYALAGQGQWGQPQLNLGLQKARGDMIYFLDDDNILHPDLLDGVRPFLDLSRVLVVNQVWPDGSLRLRAAAPIRVGNIDTAQVLVPRNIALEAPFHPTSDRGDGLYFRGIWERHSTEFIFITRDLAYYNFLRPVTERSLIGQIARSVEERPKITDQILDQINHRLQCFDNRISVRNLKLAERYIKRELDLVVLVRVAGQAQQFSARFQYAHASMEQELRSDRRTHDVSECDCGTDPHQPDGTLLLDLVEIVDGPQNIVASQVRLGLVDDLHDVPGKALYFSITQGWIFLGGGGNGIANVPACFAGIGCGEQLPGQLVERAPERPDDIAGDVRAEQRHGGCLRDLADALRHLRIKIGADGIWLTSQEGCEGRLEIVDVMFGPFNATQQSENAPALHA